MKTIKAWGIWKVKTDKAVDTDTELPFAIFFNPQDAYDLELWGIKEIEITLNLDPDLEEQGRLVRVVRCISCKFYNIPCCTCRKLGITSGENGYCIHGLSKST